MKKNYLLLLPMALLMASTSLRASEPLVGSPADATPQNDSPDGEGPGQAVRDQSKDVLRAGSFETDMPSRRTAVFVFPLPDSPAPSTLDQAHFSVRLFSKRGTPDYDVDLWALRVAPPGEEDILPSDYGAGPEPDGPESQVLLEPSFATPTSPDEQLICSSDAAAALAKFLQEHWIPGGSLLIRLNPASSTDFGARDDGGTLDQGYDFGSADHADTAEHPSLELVP